MNVADNLEDDKDGSLPFCGGCHCHQRCRLPRKDDRITVDNMSDERCDEGCRGVPLPLPVDVNGGA